MNAFIMDTWRAYLKSLDLLNKNNRLQASLFEEGMQKKAEIIVINMLKK